MRALIEDGIMINGCAATAGSKMLEGVVSVIEAEAIRRLRDAKCDLAQCANSAEFGLGEATAAEFARAIMNGEADFALFCDISGAKTRDAVQKGLCVLRPGFGTVSRFGVIPVMSSADAISIAAQTPDACFAVLMTIAGQDSRDSLSVEMALRTDDTEVGAFGITSKELPYSGIYGDVLDVIRSAEFMGNASRYDGMRYGYRADGAVGVDDIYLRSRTEGLGAEARLAIIMGEFVLSEEQFSSIFERAMRARRLISEAVGELLEKYRVLGIVGDDGLAETAAILLGLPMLKMQDTTFIARNGDDMVLLAATEGER